MPQYGEIRVDYITYTTGVSPEANRTVTVSSLVNNPIFSGDVIVDGDVTVSGDLNVSGSINGSGLLISGITGLFESGSAADPSISFIEDEDTGFFNYEPNGVGITTSGVQHFAMDASGRVNVGNTETGISVDRGFSVRNNEPVKFSVSHPSGTFGSGTIELKGTTNTTLSESNQVFLTAGQDTSPGIGITATRFDLDIRNEIDSYDSPQRRLSVLSSGYFGFNVSQPSGIVQIGGVTTSGVPTLYLSRGPSVATTTDIALSANANIKSTSSINNLCCSGGIFTWGTGGTGTSGLFTGKLDVSEMMRLNANGNLGLATNNPTLARFQVSRLGENYAGVGVPSGTAIFTFNGSTSTTDTNYITIAGGTEARAGVVFQTTGQTNSAFVRHEAESGKLEFGTNQTIRTVIDSAGRFVHNEIPNFSGIPIGGTATPHAEWGGNGTSGRSAFINWSNPYYLMLARATSGVGDYSAVEQNNELGRIVGVGANGLDFNSQSCEVRFRAAEDFTSGSTPGRIELRTAPSGGTATQRQVIITSSGTLGVGDINETAGLLEVARAGSTGQASLHLVRSPNINNTSDIALSANSCIGGQNSINYVVTESGAYHRFYVNGDGNTSGIAGATPVFEVNEDGALLTSSGTQYDIITSEDIGSRATQIPLNRDLGSMAYQNNNPYVTALRFPTAANALVYEEGSFDEKVNFDAYERSTGTDIPVTFTLRSTNYVRIGSQVTCNIRAQISPNSGTPFVNVGDRIQWSISGLAGVPYLPEGYTNQNVFNNTWTVSRRSNSTDGWLAGIGVAGGVNGGVLFYNPVTVTSTSPTQDYPINGGSWIFNTTYLLLPLPT